MDLILGILGFLLLLLVVVAFAVVAASVLLGVGLAKTLEWLADKLAPRKRTGLGVEGLIGDTATVVKPFSAVSPSFPPEGMVRLHGELWMAKTQRGAQIEVGHPVEVVAVESMMLVVRRKDT